jgi:hypothetical protein
MQNFNPIYTLTPKIGVTKITNTSSSSRSDGNALDVIGKEHFISFTPGASGSFIQRIRFSSVASASITGIITTLRVFYSTTGSGIPSSSNTFLIAEIGVPAIPSANSTNGSNYYEVPLNMAIPSSSYILVSQHVSQSAGQFWQAMVFGGDY